MPGTQDPKGTSRHGMNIPCLVMPLKEVRISNALQYIATKIYPKYPKLPQKQHTTPSRKKKNAQMMSRCQWSQGQQSDSRHLQHQKVDFMRLLLKLGNVVVVVVVLLSQPFVALEHCTHPELEKHLKFQCQHKRLNNVNN